MGSPSILAGFTSNPERGAYSEPENQHEHFLAERAEEPAAFGKPNVSGHHAPQHGTSHQQCGRGPSRHGHF